MENRVSTSILERYFELEKNVIARMLIPFQGFLERLLADPGFLTKVAIECGIGIFTKCSAEYSKRKGRFTKELDFVFANVVMAIIADFMLVWLPAPAFPLAARQVPRSNSLTRFFASCPDNAFQVVQPGMARYTVLERGGAIVRNGGKLLAIGCASSIIGVALTNALLMARRVLAPDAPAGNPPQDILKTSLAYGSYMAVSSNLRYQILAGIIEERLIEKYIPSRQVCGIMSLIVRTGNTFLGSLMWVDYIRLLGMQKATSEEPPKPEAKPKKGWLKK